MVASAALSSACYFLVRIMQSKALFFGSALKRPFALFILRNFNRPDFTGDPLNKTLLLKPYLISGGAYRAGYAS